MFFGCAWLLHIICHLKLDKNKIERNLTILGKFRQHLYVLFFSQKKKACNSSPYVQVSKVSTHSFTASQPTETQKSTLPPLPSASLHVCCTWVVWVCPSSPVHRLPSQTLAHFLSAAPGPSSLLGWSCCCSPFGSVRWHQEPATERDACRDRQEEDERNEKNKERLWPLDRKSVV